MKSVIFNINMASRLNNNNKNIIESELLGPNNGRIKCKKTSDNRE